MNLRLIARKESLSGHPSSCYGLEFPLNQPLEGRFVEEGSLLEEVCEVQSIRNNPVVYVLKTGLINSMLNNLADLIYHLSFGA